MKGKIMNRQSGIIIGIIALVLIVSCNSPFQAPGKTPDNAGIKVSLSINNFNTRSILPLDTIGLDEVDYFELFAAKIDEPYDFITSFTYDEYDSGDGPITFYLSEEGFYNFNLEAIKDGVHVLQGKALEQEISLNESNNIYFELLPFKNQGIGDIEIVFTFPSYAEIDRIEVVDVHEMKPGLLQGDFDIEHYPDMFGSYVNEETMSEIPSFTYHVNEISSDDYLLSFRFYNGSGLWMTITELVVVRSGLTGTTEPIFVDSRLVTVPGETLFEKLTWINNNAGSEHDYTLILNANEVINNGAIRYLYYPDMGNIRITLICNTTPAKVISYAEADYLFKVGTGVTLVLDENITLEGKTGNDSALVVVENGGTLIMNNGSRIYGNENNSGVGGAVYLAFGAFKMYGGVITDNSADFGGAVYVQSNLIGGSFVMSGSSVISENSAVTDGGGVYVNALLTGREVFTMDGGFIMDNNAGNNGGGVFAYGFASSQTFKMNGGTISNNFAAGNGGGVCVTMGTFIMDGTALIINNDADNGGGVYNNLGKFNMIDGTIQKNNAVDFGGGVFIKGELVYDAESGTWKSAGYFSKTGGTIYGINSLDDKNQVFSDDHPIAYHGHAVYADYDSYYKYKDNTAGPTMNLSTEPAQPSLEIYDPIFNGEWDMAVGMNIMLWPDELNQSKLLYDISPFEISVGGLPHELTFSLSDDLDIDIMPGTINTPRITWYMYGTPVLEGVDHITLNADDFNPSVYTVTVVVWIKSVNVYKPYSCDISFTVLP